MKTARWFPVFINIRDRLFLMVGAGSIALRRIDGLLRFGARVRVVAPQIHDGIRKLESQYGSEQLQILVRKFERQDLEGVEAVLAATDVPQVDALVYEEAKKRGLLVNIASDQSKCDFQFPALVETEDLVIGVNSGGRDHKLVRKVSSLLREFFAEKKEETSQGRTKL